MYAIQKLSRFINFKDHFFQVAVIVSQQAFPSFGQTLSLLWYYVELFRCINTLLAQHSSWWRPFPFARHSRGQFHYYLFLWLIHANIINWTYATVRKNYKLVGSSLFFGLFQGCISLFFCPAETADAMESCICGKAAIVIPFE